MRSVVSADVIRSAAAAKPAAPTTTYRQNGRPFSVAKYCAPAWPAMTRDLPTLRRINRQTVGRDRHGGCPSRLRTIVMAVDAGRVQARVAGANASLFKLAVGHLLAPAAHEHLAPAPPTGVSLID